MTTTFYAPASCFEGAHVALPPEEAHHAIKVLRHRVGDRIHVVDGVGGWYAVEIKMLDRRRVQGRVVEKQTEVGEPTYHLTVGLALLKNPSRYDWFLEKAVELGVSRIVPLLTERTQKKQFKTVRAEKRLIAAMKQAGRSRLPELAEPIAFTQALTDKPEGLHVICHEATARDANLYVLLARGAFPATLSVFVGPEGGFSDAEIEQAQAAGLQVASLGPRRLRAETAAIVSATTVVMAAEQKSYGT